jgi:arylsulfatase A-like enzyme
MKGRSWIQLARCGLVLPIALAAAAGVATAQEAVEEIEPETGGKRLPNLVIILADDLGYGDVGAYGSERIATPNIDALAAHGVRFTEGYVTAAVCSPSRAGLMTGRYQERFGYDFNDSSRTGLPLTETTLGERLKRAGYATGAIGKWHLGFSDEQQPLRRGFDEFFGMASGSIYITPGTPGTDSYWPAEYGMPEKRRRPIYRGDTPVEETEYLTDAITREAVDFIRRHRDEPFFLYLAHHAPHSPLQATDKYLERYAHVEDRATRIYSAMVSALDDGVGAVTATLRELGLEDNTLVVFLSDNGCALYLMGACSNQPLNGGKRFQLEGGVRIPFIVSWPDRIPAGGVFSRPASALDLVPTLIAAAGVTETPPELDGVNLLPYLLGEREGAPHQRLFWRAGANRAVRDGSWKLWQVNRTTEETLASIEPQQLLRNLARTTESPHGQLTVLYDLSADVGEKNNLAADQAEQVERLLGLLDEWSSEMVAPTIDSTRGTAARIDGVPVELVF